MNEALDELFTRLGFDRRALWRISVFFWVLFVGSCVLAIYLSAWDMKKVIVAGLYLYMMFVALPFLFAPAFWLIAGGAFAIAGQFGRERGLSLKDAIDAVKEYGKPTLNTAGYVFLLALPIWFIAMFLIDTKGIEEWFLLGLPILPTVIFLCVRRWPDGKTFEAIVRTTLLVLVLGILGWGIFSTIQHKVADPSSVVLLEYQQKQERQTIEREERVAKDLTALKKSGKAFTAEQKAVWEYLEKKRLAQSLRPADLVESLVEAKPTQSAWWKEHWLALAVTIGGIALAVYSRRRLSGSGGGTAVAGTTVAAPAGAHAPAKKKGWVGKILFILIAGGLGYLYVTERIWYSQERDVMVEHLGDQQVCGLPADAWLTFRVVNPVVVYAGRPGERPSPYTLTDSFRMVRDLEESPKRFAHPGEVLRTNQFGCTAWSFPMDEGFRKVAIVTELGHNRRSVLLHFESVAPWRWHK